MSDDFTHFGYERVKSADKAARVGAVFDSVASRYDVMNDLMSAGLHRWWKRAAVALSLVKTGDRVLDLAAGTGDMARLLLPRVGPSGAVVLVDITETLKWQDELLAKARKIMTYPAVIGTLVLSVILFMMIFVVPDIMDAIMSESERAAALNPEAWIFLTCS